MAMLGLKLLLETPMIGLAALLSLIALGRIRHCPAALLVLAGAVIVGWAGGSWVRITVAPESPALPQLVIPTASEIWRSITLAVLPQLSLTLTNAVIVTAAVARELFPIEGMAVSERKLAVSSGLANLLLCPFGAMPMCHGAGGLQAQYRFGARTGLAPIMFGTVLLVLALGFADHAAGLFALIPSGAVGALLILAGSDLAISRRLFDGKPSCMPVIGITALVTLTVNPALGLVLGWVAEFLRAAIVRRLLPERPNP
jgi:MFS superfamily sulfate permease-like transporter